MLILFLRRRSFSDEIGFARSSLSITTVIFFPLYKTEFVFSIRRVYPLGERSFRGAFFREDVEYLEINLAYESHFSLLYIFPFRTRVL